MEYSVAEQMVCVVARSLHDHETGFIGVGTGGRAFILAVGIPAVAAAVAQRLYAPRFNIMFGPIVNPDFDKPPRLNTEKALIDWPCEAQIPVEEALGVFRRGKMAVGFISAAQIDVQGNVNILEVQRASDTIRLPGALAQPDHMAYARRIIILANCDPRVFVDRVYRRSGSGFNPRLQRGPEAIVTDVGVFAWIDGRPRLTHIYEGVCVETVRARVPWPDAVDPDGLEVVAPPSAEELTAIRMVDRDGLWLRAVMSGVPGSLG